jgi:hypothetical protein
MSISFPDLFDWGIRPYLYTVFPGGYRLSNTPMPPFGIPTLCGSLSW